MKNSNENIYTLHSYKISQANTAISASRIILPFPRIFCLSENIIVFAVNVILDPATAHAALVLSEGNKCVTCGEESQDLPKDPQRLNSLPCVLGHSVFTSGRWYWEVDVRDSGAWDLGICRSNVMRQGKICVKPENGFWAIRSYKDEYWVLTSPEMQLTLKEHPTRVCIFLDYEGGCISFYNMMDKSHIYTFSQGPFNVSLRPFFRLWLGYSKSLTICPVPNA